MIRTFLTVSRGPGIDFYPWQVGTLLILSNLSGFLLTLLKNIYMQLPFKHNRQLHKIRKQNILSF